MEPMSMLKVTGPAPSRALVSEPDQPFPIQLRQAEAPSWPSKKAKLTVLPAKSVAS